jgi:hypothetical protein
LETKYVIPTQDELLAELAEELAEPIIPDGAITVRMLMTKTGKCEMLCRRFLEKKVADGLMGVVRNKITKWYYPIGVE